MTVFREKGLRIRAGKEPYMSAAESPPRSGQVSSSGPWKSFYIRMAAWDQGQVLPPGSFLPFSIYRLSPSQCFFLITPHSASMFTLVEMCACIVFIEYGRKNWKQILKSCLVYTRHCERCTILHNFTWASPGSEASLVETIVLFFWTWDSERLWNFLPFSRITITSRAKIFI